jgi:quinol monooxygenase YgiN
MSSGHIIVHASIVAKPEHLEKVREGKSVLIGSRNTEIFPLRRLVELTSLRYTIIRSPSTSTSTSIFASTLVLAIEHEYAFTLVVVTNIRDYARKEEEGTLIYRTSISNENERKFEFFEEVSLSLFPLSSSLSPSIGLYRSCLVLLCFMRECEA